LKKKLIGFLIMTLVVSNIAFLNTSSVHAETIDSTTTTNNKIKVSLENIRDIMTDNNLDIKMLDNKLKIARETYKEAKDAIEDKPSKPNSTDNDNYEADLAAYTKELASYNAAEAAYEKAKDNIKTARDNYEKGVESKVITAEQDYINYLGTLSEKQLQMDTAKSTERDAKILKIK
jgi:outer membrane protein TolC